MGYVLLLAGHIIIYDGKCQLCSPDHTLIVQAAIDNVGTQCGEHVYRWALVWKPGYKYPENPDVQNNIQL